MRSMAATHLSKRKFTYEVCLLDFAGRIIERVGIDRPVTRIEALKHVEEALERFKGDDLVYGANARRVI